MLFPFVIESPSLLELKIGRVQRSQQLFLSVTKNLRVKKQMLHSVQHDKTIAKNTFGTAFFILNL